MSSAIPKLSAVPGGPETGGDFEQQMRLSSAAIPRRYEFHASYLYSAGIGFVMLLVLMPNARWWSVLSFLPDLTVKRIAFIAVLCFLGSAGLTILSTKARPRIVAQGFAPVLLFLAAINWLDTEYSFLMGPMIRGELLLACILAALCFRYRTSQIFAWSLLITVVSMIANYLMLARGRLIFSDDHPVFLFRLEELVENMPRIPIYDVLWNNGLDSMYIFASGLLSVYVLFFPLVQFFPLTDVYSYLPLIICAVFTPLAMYISGRIMGLDRDAALTSGILSVCASLFWYRWCLKYGTLGFSISSLLFPLVCAYVFRAFEEHPRFSKSIAAGLVLLTSLCISWPLICFAFLPAAVLALTAYRRCWLQKNFTAAVIVILLVNVPWMLLFWTDYALPKALAPHIEQVLGDNEVQIKHAPGIPQVPKKHDDHDISLDKSLLALRDNRAATHPLVIFLALPGVLLLQRRARVMFGATLVWLLLLGAVIAPKQPQLELDRMLVVFAIVACLPAGQAVCRLWHERKRSVLHACSALLTVAFLLAGCRGAIEAMGSKRVESFSFAGPFLYQFADAIRTHAGTGRALFAGFVLHDLEKGHLAPLSTLTGVPLVASSHLHTLWTYTSIFPQEVLDQGDAGMDRFLDLNNATSVIAHETQWKNYFQSRPQAFRLAWQGGKYMIFTRLTPPAGYFLEGSGEVLKQGSGGVTLRVDSTDAVIKFNYFPSLQAPGCSAISGQEVPYTHRHYIRLTGCKPGAVVTIASKSFLTRVMEAAS